MFQMWFDSLGTHILFRCVSSEYGEFVVSLSKYGEFPTSIASGEFQGQVLGEYFAPRGLI